MVGLLGKTSTAYPFVENLQLTLAICSRGRLSVSSVRSNSAPNVGGEVCFTSWKYPQSFTRIVDNISMTLLLTMNVCLDLRR